MKLLALYLGMLLCICSCGSGGSESHSAVYVTSDLGSYVGYVPMTVIDNQGLPHDWYMLYTTDVAAGIYLHTEPSPSYQITTPISVVMKRLYQDGVPTNDPAYIYIGNDIPHADIYLATIPGQIFH